MLDFMMGLLNIKEPEVNVESNVDYIKQSFQITECCFGKYFAWLNSGLDITISDDDRDKLKDMLNDYAKIKRLAIRMAERQDKLETRFQEMEGKLNDIQAKLDILCDRLLTVLRKGDENTEKLLRHMKKEE